ncbi:MAG: hypothetical protein RLZZ127_838 [Planctomycetota bacterium]|jgi:phospholipid/cholesterol/gamma-HCH transport system ATP-binding protein
MSADRRWTMAEMEQGVPLAAVPEGRTPLIRLRDLTRSFGSRQVLRGLTADIYRGETFVVLGGSGSGKTTLLRHLMGLLQPAPAQLKVAATDRHPAMDLGEADETAMLAWRRRLGVVFQNAALLNSLTILENVGLPLVEVDRRPEPEVVERVCQALRKVYLKPEEVLHLKPAELSGGMRKRAGIARALIQEPEIVLYDEPTTGLDPVTTSGVGALITDLRDRLGVTGIVITHDLPMAFAIADRIAVLHRGRFIALGAPDEVRADPNPVVRQLLTGSVDGPLTEGYA